MKIKNISEGNFNLKSGVLKPGGEGEATYEECKVLFSSSKAEAVVKRAAAPRKAAPKPMSKKVK